MNKVPPMVSTKDAMYITDILNIMHAFVKKFKHYDNEIQDSKLKQLVCDVTNGLCNQYDCLLEELNG